MKRNSSKHLLTIVALCLLGLLAFDRLLLSPYLTTRTRLASEKKELSLLLRQDRELFERKELWATQWENLKKAGFSIDPGEAENNALKSVREWISTSGLTLVSLKPERIVTKKGAKNISIQALCAGTIPKITEFLWHIESSSLPLKITGLQLSMGKEERGELSLQVRIALFLPSDKENGSVSTANSQKESIP